MISKVSDSVLFGVSCIFYPAVPYCITSIMYSLPIVRRSQDFERTDRIEPLQHTSRVLTPRFNYPV
jgi:hypothetical protein